MTATATWRRVAAPPACRCTTMPAWPNGSAAPCWPAISPSTCGDASARLDALKLPGDEAGCMAALRRFRHAEALRLVFRDVNALDELPETLFDTSVLYETMLAAALEWATQAMASRYGHSRSADGALQRLLVVGFGKLGGSELNFSSDIDLLFAYPHGGQSDGARVLDNSEYFVRLGRQLVRLLNEPTMDGICARAVALAAV